jgi:hypothetical protein
VPPPPTPPSSDLPPTASPEALARLLPPDVDLATGRGLRHEAARPVWHGVVWGRLARGDLAWAHFDRVNLRELAPWIAAERGRVLRELGHHADAESIEWPALLNADDPVDQAMLRISLVADAVGIGDVRRATSRLEAAQQAVDALPAGPRTSRQRIRLTWVRAEVALIGGCDLQDARARVPSWHPPTGQPLLDDDHRWGTDFHRAKSLLFGGVLHRDGSLLAAAAALAPPMLRWAVLLAQRDVPVLERPVSGSDNGAQRARIVDRAALSAIALEAAREVVAPPRVAFDAMAVARDAQVEH